MKADFILLRLGELTLKGRNRTRFENAALEDVRERLRPFERITFTREFGRIYLQLNGEPYDQVAEQLKRVFGLHSFSPVTQVEADLEAIRQATLAIMQALPQRPRTFKVIVRRSDKSFPHDSMEMNHLVGGYVLHHMPGLAVDVHHPEVELRVEIRQQAAYVYSQVERALGGFPVGSNGKAMMLLSGGIDSPVAAWLSMKRGLEIEAIHFHSTPYTSERALDKVIELTRTLAQYTNAIKLHLVPFADLQIRLHQAYKGNLEITITRRIMLRIAERLAKRHGAEAIVTGESLGQVASQTITSLGTIGRVASLPLLRPLIMMDKSEIIEVAERIGSYPISILPYDDCCTLFVPRSPSTKPNLGLVEQIESRLDWLEAEIDKAVTNTETKHVAAQQPEAIDEYF